MQKQVRQTILTPRSYISWSQYSTLKQSKQSYINTYIFNEDYSNEGQDLGARIHRAYEHDEESKDQIIEHARLLIPRYGKHNYELISTLKGIKIKSYLDDFNGRKRILHELKTGKIKWTQAKVDRHEQIDFYSLNIYQYFGWLPKQSWLTWLPTDPDDENYLIPQQFDATRSLVQILKMAGRVIMAWSEILKISKKYKKELYETQDTR